jgi:pilus assembly protein FimV
MLLSLYRSNPGAFIGGNINRLKAGAVLKVPSATEARELPASTARREVQAHTQGFRSYRERLATSAVPSAEGDGRQVGGRVTARVQDRAVPEVEGRDELTLSRAERDGRKGMAAVQEQLIAKDRALKDAQDRLAQLEKNLADLQRLMVLKNGASAVAGSDGGATGQVGTAPSDAGALAVPAPPALTPSTPAQAGGSMAASTPAQASTDLAASADAASSVAGAGATAAATTAATAPTPTAPAPAPQPLAPQPGFFASLMSNPMILGAPPSC